MFEECSVNWNILFIIYINCPDKNASCVRNLLYKNVDVNVHNIIQEHERNTTFYSCFVGSSLN